MASKTLKSIIVAGVLAVSALVPAAAIAIPANVVPEAKEEGVTVRVVNNNWSDMRVYVVQDRSRIVRLGTVTSFTTTKFQLPRWFNPSSDQLQLVLRGIGGQSSATAPVLVSEGDLVELRIENNISTSNVRVVSQDS